MEDNIKDKLDEYLEKSSSILDKSYLDTENESKYLDKFNKTDGSDRSSYLDRLNDPEAKQEKSYLDRLNDPEGQPEKGYLETITFDYLNQDTTIKDIKIDYGYLDENQSTPPKPEENPPIAGEQESLKEAPEPEQIQTEKEPVVVEESQIIDHKTQLPRSVWNLTEGAQTLHSGTKTFSSWQPQAFRGTGKLRKVWSAQLEGDTSQLWPIVTMDTWFLGPYAKVDPETGVVRQLKKPLIPEFTDGYRIIGAMKLDDNWWRVAINLDTAEFSGKICPAANPRGSFKNINRMLLYLDARAGEKPSLIRLNPENFNILWKLEPNNRSNQIINAGTAFESLWIFQHDTEPFVTNIDPVKGIPTDYSFPKYTPCDCFDFWGKFFLTTTMGVLLEFSLSQKTIVKEMPLGNVGWTTTFLHSFENLAYLKSTKGDQIIHYALDPLSGEFNVLKVIPRKDGSYLFPDGRYFRKMDLKTNETIWFLDDQYVSSVLLEDERGILTRSGQTLTLWS